MHQNISTKMSTFNPIHMLLSGLCTSCIRVVRTELPGNEGFDLVVAGVVSGLLAFLFAVSLGRLEAAFDAAMVAMIRQTCSIQHQAIQTRAADTILLAIPEVVAGTTARGPVTVRLFHGGNIYNELCWARTRLAQQNKNVQVRGNEMELPPVLRPTMCTLKHVLEKCTGRVIDQLSHVPNGSFIIQIWTKLALELEKHSLRYIRDVSNVRTSH
mmetsp:Transcript_8299/g.51675  ORF Transcript_8299/g.51675 Transcript_8299/m.51675 type:complete len:213 (+) Transcript_8299:7197-7835(+)